MLRGNRSCSLAIFLKQLITRLFVGSSDQAAQLRDHVESNQDLPGDVVQSSIHEQVKRLSEYSKKAIVYEFSLAVAFSAHITLYSNSVCIKICIAFLFLALFADLTSAIHLLNLQNGRSPCRWHCVLVYISNISLMLTPYFLLLYFNNLYSFLAVALLPLLVVVGALFLKECRAGLSSTRGGSASYEEYDTKLKHLFDLSAAVNTIAGAGGLMGTIFGHSKNSSQQDVNLVECSLFLTIIVALFMMLLTTVRPAFNRDDTPRKLVHVLELLGRWLLGLLALSALAGAAESLGGFAVLGFSCDFMEVAVCFLFAFCDEADVVNDGDPEQRDTLQRLSVAITACCFTALMELYSKNVGREEDMGFHVKARMLLYFSALVCSLNRMLLNAFGAPRGGVWGRVLEFLGRLRAAIVVLATLDVPHQLLMTLF